MLGRRRKVLRSSCSSTTTTSQEGSVRGGSCQPLVSNVKSNVGRADPHGHRLESAVSLSDCDRNKLLGRTHGYSFEQQDALSLPLGNPSSRPIDRSSRSFPATVRFAAISLAEVDTGGKFEMKLPSLAGGRDMAESRESAGSGPLLLRRHPLHVSVQDTLARVRSMLESVRNLRLQVHLPVFRLPLFDEVDSAEAVTALNHIYAGSMARTLSQVVCHPIDTVKTRMQIKDPTKKLRKWRRKVAKNAIGIGPIDIDNWFFKGPSDVFRGLWGAVLGTIPNALLYFVTYECTKRRLEKVLPGGVVHVVSASAGTVAASIVRVPADTLKHRVQAYLHKNVFEAFKVVVETEGIGGLYRGFWPTLMRDVPEIAIQFAVYENLRAVVQRRRKVEKLTTPEHLVLGACAGALAATFTMPLDLVKTRQQCGISQGIHRIVQSVLQESGPAGLLAGLGPRVFHVSLMSAVFFGLFEYCKLVMKPDRSPSDRLYLPKIWNKRRDHIWKRQFVYTE